MPVTPEDFRTAMAADWEKYHATYECSDDSDLQQILDKAKGNLKKALKLAKADTDFFNEMQSNCY